MPSTPTTRAAPSAAGEANARKPLTMAPTEWALLGALATLWGGSFFFTGVAVAELPTFTIAAARVALAALVLWIVIAALGRQVPLSREVVVAFAVMGVLNNAIPFTLFVYGQQTIASGLAAILNATTPIFTVLVAGALLPDERMTPARLLGVALGLAGVAVMVGPDALTGLGDDLFAQLACVGAALSYAFAGVWGRRFRRLGVPPLTVAAGQVSASALLLVPFALALEAPWTLPMPGVATLLALAGLAVLSTALAYILYFEILARAGATNVLLVTLLVPITAVLLGTLVLGERLEWVHAAGMALIALGLSTIDGRLWRRRRVRAG